MSVGDLVWSASISNYCEWAVYDCTEGIPWDEAEILCTSEGTKKPRQNILDMKVRCLAIHDSVLRIEATR